MNSTNISRKAHHKHSFLYGDHCDQCTPPCKTGVATQFNRYALDLKRDWEANCLVYSDRWQQVSEWSVDDIDNNFQSSTSETGRRNNSPDASNPTTITHRARRKRDSQTQYQCNLSRGVPRPCMPLTALIDHLILQNTHKGSRGHSSVKCAVCREYQSCDDLISHLQTAHLNPTSLENDAPAARPNVTVDITSKSGKTSDQTEAIVSPPVTAGNEKRTASPYTPLSTRPKRQKTSKKSQTVSASPFSIAPSLYQCPYCYWVFQSSSQTSVPIKEYHMMDSTPQDHKCQFEDCDRHYTRIDSLRRHLRQDHRISLLNNYERFTTYLFARHHHARYTVH